MTEPSLLTAFAPMDEAEFKTFCRKHGPAFAQAAADIVVAGSEDFLLLRYLKAQRALYLAFVFRWADRAEDIEKRPYFKTLIESCQLMRAGESAWIVVAYGAMNFLADGVEKAWRLTPEGAIEITLDAATLKGCDALLNANLFRKGMTEGVYQQAMLKPSVLATPIRKQAETLLEKRRRRLASEAAPDATPEKPVCLFSGYHFNGRFVVRYDIGALTPLPDLDPTTMRQKPWGAIDARHAVVGDRVIATDPARFRAVPLKSTEGLSFYRDDRAVYNSRGARVEGADPASFRHVKAGYLRDAQGWWYYDATPLVGVAPQARVVYDLYFFDRAFLISAESVYVGKERLDVDAATFEILRSENVVSPHYKRQNGLTHGRDKSGHFVISVIEGAMVFERALEPEKLWGTLAAREPDWSEKFAAYRDIQALRPRWLDEAPYTDAKPQAIATLRRYVDAFEPWFDSHEQKFRDAPANALNANTSFWDGFLPFFYACWRLGEDEKLARLYRRIESVAWAQPPLYLYAPRALARLGAKADAIRALRNGLESRADMGFFFDSPEGASLMGEPAYEDLKAFYLRRGAPRQPFLSFHVLRGLVETQTRIMSEDDLARAFYIPSPADIDAAFDDADQATEYKRLLMRVALDYVAIRLASGRRKLDKDFYRAVSNLPDLPAAVHLFGALGLFAEGWFWIELDPTRTHDRLEFPEAMQAIGRMRAALAKPGAADDPLWRDIARQSDLAPFIALAN